MTPPPMEAIIDLRCMSQWDRYLLWQANVEERSARKISQLTGLSKSLIAEELRYLHANH